MVEVSVREARDRISELLNSAAAGEDVVITRRGKPIAKMVAIDTHETTLSFPDHRDFRSQQPVAKSSSAELIRELRHERR